MAKLLLYFDRSFSGGIKGQLTWLLAIMLAVYLFLVLFSCFGIFYDSGAAEGPGRWYDVMMILLGTGKESNAAHTPLVLLVSLLSMIVFSGMLISVISNLLQRRVDNYRAGKTTYSVSCHIIVLGYNKGLPSLVQKVCIKHPQSYVLLMCGRKSSQLRDWLRANLDDNADRVIVMNGDINASDDLERLCLQNKPKEIYVLGDEDDSGHDDSVLESIEKLSALIPDEDTTDCYVQVNSSSMFALLQKVEFCKDACGEQIYKNIIFHPFNFNEIWAQKVLSLTSLDGSGYRPLDGTGIGRNSKKRVHLIIAGMTDLGKSLAINASQVLHFPNFKEGDLSTYTRITFIDQRVDELGERFRNRYQIMFQLARWKSGDCWHDPLSDEKSGSPYKHLGPDNFIDVEWEFIQGDAAQGHVRDYLSEACNSKGSLTTVALCYDDSDRNLAVCMSLPEAVIEGRSLNMVLVRQKESDVAIGLLNRMPGDWSKVRAFGMMKECYEENLLSDDFGKLVNALYTYGTADVLTPATENARQIEEAWARVSILDKWASNYSANMLFVKLRSLGFDATNISRSEIEKKLAQPDTKDDLMKVEHNRWNVEKIMAGFHPLTAEEQDEFKPFNSNRNSEDAARVRAMAKAKAKERKKHLDICSNAMLKDLDPKAVSYDDFVNNAMWEMYMKIVHRQGVLCAESKK